VWDDFGMPVPRALVRLTLVSLALSSAACLTSEAPQPPSLPVPRLVSVPSPPEWRPGDRWTYAVRSGNDSGTKTMEVYEVREIGKVPYYVMRLGVGDLDHYYTRSLDWAAAIRALKVEARMIPPCPWFVWPLEVGKSWTYRGVWEEQDSTRDLSNRFAVVAVEAVEVPAGRFEALKVVRETDTRDFDEYWYAPAVRWHVLWKGRRGDFEFEERLQTYDPAPRLIPSGSDIRTR
jgi:hypothetical protein